MAQWTDRIESHQVFTDVGILDDLLKQVRDRLPDDAEAVAAYDRLAAINDRTAGLLKASDPQFVHPQVLANISNALSSVVAEVRAFLSNANPQHLQNANSSVDPILLQLWQLPASPPADSIPAESVRRVRQLSESAITSLSGRIAVAQQSAEQLNVRIQELTNEINSQKGRLDAAIAQYQQQFSQSEDARRAQFAQSEQQRADAATQQEQERKELSDELYVERRKAFDKLQQALEAEEKVLRDKLAADAEGLLKGIEAHRDRAQKIVGIISESGMVHGYQRVANAEKQSAYRWHWIAGLSMVGLIGFAIFAFWETLGASFNWGTFGGRAFVALTFGILAAYAARQADKHEQVERRSRRLELELAALDPFLEPLPEAERHAVKRQMADRLFGQPDTIPVSTPSDTTGSVIDLLKLAIQGLAKK